MKKNKAVEKRIVFFEKNSWYHRYKELKEDMTVAYRKKGGFATPEEAEKSYWEYEEKFKAQQRKIQILKLKNADVMLGDYLQYWFENIYSTRIETTTRMVGSYTLYELLVPSIETDIKLKYVSVEYLDSLLSRVAKGCPSAGNKSRELLSLAFKDAVTEGLITYNPVSETIPYKRKKPKVRVLSKEKLKELLSVASTNAWFLEILLGVFCGLRKGEILGLKFSDFDFENNTVRIQRQLVANLKITEGEFHVEEYKVKERAPKTENSFRILRVPEAVMTEVKRRQMKVERDKEIQGDRYKDFDYVSCQENGEPHGLASFNTALTKLCKRNGLPRITVHGLRHMFATILLEQGVPLVKISGLLGHGSIHTTYEYYCDVMDEKDKIIAFMNNTFVPEQSCEEEQDGEKIRV